MKRIGMKYKKVLKREFFLFESCGKECGQFCPGDRTCNQVNIGKGFKEIPPEEDLIKTSGFPPWCPLPIDEDVSQGELGFTGIREELSRT